MSVKKKRAASKAYSLAEPISTGTVLTDIRKNRWCVGTAIAQGGFGCIYSVKQWLTQKKISFLGIPRYVSSGLVTPSGQGPCRFLIMDRFTGDFESVLQGGKAQPDLAIKASIGVLDALEYLHSKDHAHADIKASNLLYTNSVEQVTLVDFGLVHLFRVRGVHKPEKIDPKFKHCGTAEFCSRDAHMGLPPSQRGDLEILVFNLIHWLARCQSGAVQSHSTGLPWHSLLSDPKIRKNLPIRVLEKVAELKESAMKNPQQFASSTGFSSSPDLIQFIQIVRNLTYTETPDYARLHRCLATLQTQARTHGKSTTSKPPRQAASLKRSSLDKLDHVGVKSAQLNSDSDRSDQSGVRAAKVPVKRSRGQPVERRRVGREAPSESVLGSVLPLDSATPTLKQLATDSTPRGRKVNPPTASKTTPQSQTLPPPRRALPRKLVDSSQLPPTRSSPRLQALKKQSSSHSAQSFTNGLEWDSIFSDSEDEFDEVVRNPSSSTAAAAAITPQPASAAVSAKVLNSQKHRKVLSPLNPTEEAVRKPSPLVLKVDKKRCSGWCQTSPELLELAKAEALGRRAANMANLHWSQR